MPDSFLNVGSLHSIGHADLNGDDLTQQDRPGRYAYCITAFGPAVYVYGRNTSGSIVAQGELMSRLGDVAATNITAGSTTSATLAAAWTANKHVGEMLFVLDNADSAGAAPEAEISIIGSNTADVCNVDANYPYSVALAANDDLDTISPGWHWKDSAAGEVAQEVKGIVVAKAGVTSLYYGWLQCYGIHPRALLTSGALADRAAIIAGTKSCNTEAPSGWQLVIGYAIGETKADLVTDYGPVFINVYSPTLNADTP
jgi:hypothetical protein